MTENAESSGLPSDSEDSHLPAQDGEQGEFGLPAAGGAPQPPAPPTPAQGSGAHDMTLSSEVIRPDPSFGLEDRAPLFPEWEPMVEAEEEYAAEEYTTDDQETLLDMSARRSTDRVSMQEAYECLKIRTPLSEFTSYARARLETLRGLGEGRRAELTAAALELGSSALQQVMGTLGEESP